jgi:hypothetical protein
MSRHFPSSEGTPATVWSAITARPRIAESATITTGCHGVVTDGVTGIETVW